MGILPVDLQAILLRMDDMSRVRHNEQAGIVIAQTIKGGEISNLAQIESSRVNLVKPHPDGNAKIEDESKKIRSKRIEKRENKNRGKRERKKDFEEPYKGTIVDIER